MFLLQASPKGELTLLTLHLKLCFLHLMIQMVQINFQQEVYELVRIPKMKIDFI